MTGDFVWRDAGRTVVFRRGGVAGAVEVLREQGVEEFELLSTERALVGAEGLAEAARGVGRSVKYQRSNGGFQWQRTGTASSEAAR